MDHAKILSAYLTRLSSRDLHLLAEKAAKCEYAGMHLGSGSQLMAQKEMADYVRDVVSRLSKHDKGIVASTVENQLPDTIAEC